MTLHPRVRVLYELRYVLVFYLNYLDTR